MQGDLDAFYSIEDEHLSKVLWRSREDSAEALWLIFTSSNLLIQANPEDDTISVASGMMLDADELVDLSSSEFWRGFVGQRFGWGWTVTNQQGYQDAILLSFDGISPQVMLEVAASTMKTRRVGEAAPVSDQTAR